MKLAKIWALVALVAVARVARAVLGPLLLGRTRYFGGGLSSRWAVER